jgi:hypothetical protein
LAELPSSLCLKSQAEQETREQCGTATPDLEASNPRSIVSKGETRRLHIPWADWAGEHAIADRLPSACVRVSEAGHYSTLVTNALTVLAAACRAAWPIAEA